MWVSLSISLLILEMFVSVGLVFMKIGGIFRLKFGPCLSFSICLSSASTEKLFESPIGMLVKLSVVFLAFACLLGTLNPSSLSDNSESLSESWSIFTYIPGRGPGFVSSSVIGGGGERVGEGSGGGGGGVCGDGLVFLLGPGWGRARNGGMSSGLYVRWSQASLMLGIYTV